MTRTLFLLLGSLFLVGCTASQPKTTIENRVNHIVMCWLKEPGNEAHRDSIIETCKSLREIPGVLEIRVGEAIPSERALVDDSFDICIMMTFASTDDMTRYIDNPLHKKAFGEVLQPLVQRIVVYDFLEEGRITSR
jgi:hypothetical protein